MIEQDEPMVTITKKEYDELLDRDEKLCALEAAGVDNWEGYSGALSGVFEEEEDDD